MLTDTATNSQKLEFLWLEVTNRCNLQCGHCYSNSGPHTGDKDILTLEDHRRLLGEARRFGCTQVQFIGGEPTLNRNLPELVSCASALGYEFIEVFTNLVRLDERLLNTFVADKVSVATSFYSDRPDVHDAITSGRGSFQKTVQNIQRVIAAGLPLRVGVIRMDSNHDDIDNAMVFLKGLGVQNVSLDDVRAFGRAESAGDCSMGDLCGNCAGNILAIGPDGVAAPCIMSKAWSVGNVLDAPLSEILVSPRLAEVRSEIANVTGALRMNCAPYQTPNCTPECAPSSQCNPCSPNGGHKCIPNGNCTPGGLGARSGALLA